MYEQYHISDLQHRIAAFEDQHAYRELYNRYQPALMRFAYTICHSKEGAEEIVSDVFIRVWVKRKTLDHIQNLKLYLYIATRNFSLNYCRNQRKFQSLQMEDLNVEMESMIAGPHERLLSAELQKQVFEVVDSLPTQCKIIFKLVKEDGLKYKEVAELLHLSAKTVENQLAIAIKRIGKAVLNVATVNSGKN